MPPAKNRQPEGQKEFRPLVALPLGLLGATVILTISYLFSSTNKQDSDKPENPPGMNAKPARIEFLSPERRRRVYEAMERQFPPIAEENAGIVESNEK